MSSVTQRIKEVKQPRGGYLNLSSFKCEPFDDGKVLANVENIHASVVGMAVDYMTRVCTGASVDDAFKISLLGAEIAEKSGLSGALVEARRYCDGITGLDSASVINACKLSTFDVWFRNTAFAFTSKRAVDTNPDADTVNNLCILIERSLAFWKKYGPVVADGFTFEPNGYTTIVDSGDGDFLTEDTLWDFKVSKKKPESKHTLQLLMYWVMGKHSCNPIFGGIHNIGLFNPRLNVVYTMDMREVDTAILNAIETEVLGYPSCLW